MISINGVPNLRAFGVISSLPIVSNSETVIWSKNLKTMPHKNYSYLGGGRRRWVRVKPLKKS